MKLTTKIKKAINVLKIKIQERKFEKTVKYVLQRSKGSSELIVSFSGFPAGRGGGRSGLYNYIRTLKGFKCNKLFILDNFGYQQRGVYYLGENGNYYVKPIVVRLIETIKQRLKIDNLITIGSSKGGTCALMFGLELNANSIIVGAPQYYIGKYLLDHKKILQSICGDVGGGYYLDKILPDIVASSRSKNTQVFLHYSTRESMYEPHIKPLINDLSLNGIFVHHDVEDYLYHDEVANYFPAYLKKTIKQLLEKGKSL